MKTMKQFSRTLTCILLLTSGAFAQTVGQKFVVPDSPRHTFNFNPGWKFIKQDVPGAEAVNFDDSKWQDISTPHTYNDTDTYDEIIVHSHGEDHEYMGVAWYRKHFKLPAAGKNGKVFLEFEGIKQAARFFVNGQPAGKFENGITACGLDITKLVKFGSDDNVIAIKVDNSDNYVEEGTNTGYEWMGRAFNPNYGGLNHDIWLHLTGPVYQTLPLYENLQTTGVYIYPTNFSIKDGTCDVNIESQVRNESSQQVITLTGVVVDKTGTVRATFQSDESDMVGGQTDTLTASGHLTGAHWWDVSDPYLYDVYTLLSVDGKVVDVCKTSTGFRKVEYKGGVGKGGVYLNDHFVYLTGYAQRSTNEWAGLGQAYPDWMHDANAKMIHDTHANYVRWMHITPQPVDVRAFDEYGIVEVAPAGDKEKDVEGRQWDQRCEVMRDSMIYLRNHPSILFWEAGNNGVTAAHMQQMVDLRKQWDPNGGRVIGCRTLNDPGTTPIAEYYGVMIGQDKQTDALKSPTDMFRAYSAERRDRAPLIETEDFRDEAARRFWDDFSPPHFGFKPGPKDTYHWNSETFCIAAIERYDAYWSNRISNPDPAQSKWSGYASIYWSDSNADGRQDSSEVARVSGKVDSVRLPKEAFFTYQVLQSPTPALHIIGHWTYPAGTKKTMNVVSNCESVELFVNGSSKGVVSKPENGFLFAFPNIEWQAGVIKAVGSNHGQAVAQQAIETAGAPARIKLTPITGPKGWQADGQDVALVDVEVVDAKGRRCPTDEARVDFKVSGPAIWRGGYNSGIVGSTNNLYLSTECGINRVALRSTLEPGQVTLTASRSGLASATLALTSVSLPVASGLATELPPRLRAP